MRDRAAFVLGVLLLAMATGAGSASQNAIGIAVAGGMVTATALGIFFVRFFTGWCGACFRVARRTKRAGRMSMQSASPAE